MIGIIAALLFLVKWNIGMIGIIRNQYSMPQIFFGLIALRIGHDKY